MAGAREIRTKIKSVQSTQKITRAMQMVAASKMRKAQNRMFAARPYAGKMRAVIEHLAHAHPEYRHPYLQDREVKRVGYVVVSSDRGLCGSLNINLFKTLVNEMQSWSDKGVEADLAVFGSKGVGFLSRFGARILAQTTHLGDRPSVQDMIGLVKVMLDAFSEARVDRLFLVSNEFINTMSQRPRVDQLVPVRAHDDDVARHYWDYLYEPDAREVLDALLARYIESMVYQGVVENIACEQAARMIAMKSASDNAATLIDDLQLAYNKERQATITQELAEIVGGAAAV
ncbi:MAG: F0F1 ATP synthase subunit gamma [Chromatiales bacterium 21-64-14]|nr:MAG: F0F1 ATP synthase subunit gamma [Chromatiales bacterium 21-64-14]HQU16242.1 F0F1 ATP synthase subunit gamma [Gammaproteobacteria bacterium]